MYCLQHFRAANALLAAATFINICLSTIQYQKLFGMGSTNVVNLATLPWPYDFDSTCQLSIY